MIHGISDYYNLTTTKPFQLLLTQVTHMYSLLFISTSGDLSGGTKIIELAPPIRQPATPTPTPQMK